MIRLGKGRATTWPSAAVEFPFFHGKASEDPFLEPLPHWKEVNDNRKPCTSCQPFVRGQVP